MAFGNSRVDAESNRRWTFSALTIGGVPGTILIRIQLSSAPGARVHLIEK